MRDSVRGKKWLTVLDLRDAFHSVKILEADRHKTAFQTKYGLFEFNVCPFGNRRSPATFIRTLNRIFVGLDGVCVIRYMDDICIYSDSKEEHLKHVEEVLRRLMTNSFRVKLSKCQFFKTSVEFCSMQIDAEGVTVTDPQREAVGNYPQIRSYKMLQSFLGAINFFRDFIPGLSDLGTPLFDLLKKNNRSSRFEDAWSVDHQMSIRVIQHLLMSSTSLAFFNPSLETFVHSDASDFAIGGWVGQVGDDGTERVVAFWSRRLQAAERNYPVHEKEFLAMHDVILKFRVHLFGRSFVALVDHKALEHLHDQPSLRPRQIRWLLSLQEFDFQVSYIPGQNNTFADWLSRRPDFARQVCDSCQSVMSITPSPPDMDDSSFMQGLLQLQQEDQFIQKLEKWKWNRGSIPSRKKGFVKKFSCLPNGVWVYKGTSLMIPDKPTQKYFLKRYHSESGHFGVNKTLQAIREHAYWPGMINDVAQFIRSCDSCQRVNQKNLTDGLMHSLPIPDSRCQAVHIDFASMPRDVGGAGVMMVMIDRLSKFIHAVPAPSSVSALWAAETLYTHWYLRGYGFPQHLTSDRDVAFTNSVWAEFIRFTGIQHSMTTARHQNANGQAEAAVKIVKNALKKLVNYHEDDWVSLLPTVLFAYNNSIHSTTKHTPFFLMHAFHPATLPTATPNNSTLGTSFQAHFAALSLAHEAIAMAQDSAADQYNRSRYKSPEYKVGDLVLVQREGLQWQPDSQRSKRLLAQWIGPYPVTEILSGDNIRLAMPEEMRCHKVFHVSKLKPYTTAADKPAPSPVIDKETGELEVEKVLDMRKRGRACQYLLKWKGLDDEFNTWENARELHNCKDLIEAYKASRSNMR
jgi:hypothetical protein